MDYGYVRVSTKEQNELRQVLGTAEQGLQTGTFFWTSNLEKTLSGRITRN